MSARAASPTETEDYSGDFIVFDGSSPEDVSHAKQLWSFLSLQPPIESRLVSVDIRQRLPVSRPQRSSITAAQPKVSAAPEPPRVPPARQREEEEERQRYRAMAEQRREILAMLRRQREQRIQREMVSLAYRQKVKNNKEKGELSELKVDQELVKQLL